MKLPDLPAEFQKQLMAKIQHWQESQVGQKSGYEYEKSFNELMQEIGKEILENSVGDEPDGRKKKDNDQLRNYPDSQRPCSS